MNKSVGIHLKWGVSLCFGLTIFVERPNQMSTPSTLEDQLKAMLEARQIRFNQMLKVLDAIPGDTSLQALTGEQVALINLKLSSSGEEECETCSG